MSPRRVPRRFVWLLGALILGGAGCTLILDYDPNALLEITPDRCRDGVDNDENGLTDCAEPGCQSFSFCQERTEEACRDRVDNDRDGAFDCDDPDCAVWTACSESLQGACADGLDNNGNGLADCRDFTCQADPHCCTLVVPTFTATFSPPANAPLVRECDADQAGSQFNAFDPTRWSSYGIPAPKRTEDGTGFDPNRCEACYASGQCAACRDAVLLSRDTFPWKPGLEVSAMLHVGDGPYDRAGVVLTWQSSVDEEASCADDEPTLDRLMGISLTSGAGTALHRLRFVVDGAVEHEMTWTEPSAAVFFRYDADGFARFYVARALDPFPARDAEVAFRSLRPLPTSADPVSLAVHGGGAGLRVSEVRVRDGGRCPDPVPTPRAGLGQGVILPAGGASAWDHAVVSDPSVIQWRGALHLFYTGRASVEGLGSIGHAEWTASATGFVRKPALAPVITADDVRALVAQEQPGLEAELSDELDLFGPAALVRQEGDDALLLYFTVAERIGNTVGRSWIMGVLTRDFQQFEPLLRTLERPAGARTVELLSPKLGAPGSWERGVSSPSVVQRGPGDYVMFYTGRADPADPFTAAIGMATSNDGVHWKRANVQPAGDPDGVNQPVLAPPQDALVQTGVSDPTVVWDSDLQVFRAWYVFRVGADFAIYHAVSDDQGLRWLTYPGNPVLRPATSAWCDDRYLDGPSVLLQPSGLMRFWYHGRSETLGHSICYAVNSFGD